MIISFLDRKQIVEPTLQCFSQMSKEYCDCNARLSVIWSHSLTRQINSEFIENVHHIVCLVTCCEN